MKSAPCGWDLKERICGLTHCGKFVLGLVWFGLVEGSKHRMTYTVIVDHVNRHWQPRTRRRCNASRSQSNSIYGTECSRWEHAHTDHNWVEFAESGCFLQGSEFDGVQYTTEMLAPHCKRFQTALKSSAQFTWLFLWKAPGTFHEKHQVFFQKDQVLFERRKRKTCVKHCSSFSKSTWCFFRKT